MGVKAPLPPTDLTADWLDENGTTAVLVRWKHADEYTVFLAPSSPPPALTYYVVVKNEERVVTPQLEVEGQVSRYSELGI